ncbi:large conductance mechanosensitive channel protein MscL [Chitinophaga agri]|uniref:Large-conductance mechanosensitive channel n=1 Tax=Chitinophaga agri TaxID=2703787 RepID=A0A6B9ZJ05_9BACT|nr:large conductance mechanosensitive channel protein MscL [Chitinophaga agri]QHS61344.1 large conductance mechanosensitive channel protein MscL [Chitinophaga agri]
MSFFKEFKEFATRGNVIDLAVGVIIGGAFQKIVNSLVENIFMPILGMVTGKIDFKEKFVQLGSSDTPVTTLAQAKEKGVTVLAYGAFIQTIIEFILIAFCIFLVVKFINTMRKKKEEAPAPAAPPAPTTQEKLLMEIRDALKNK